MTTAEGSEAELEPVAATQHPQHTLADVGNVLWGFALHILIGTGMFAIAALPAIGLDLGMHRLEELGVSSWLLLVLKTVEFILLAIDAAFLIYFVGRTTWTAAASIRP